MPFVAINSCFQAASSTDIFDASSSVRDILAVSVFERNQLYAYLAILPALVNSSFSLSLWNRRPPGGSSRKGCVKKAVARARAGRHSRFPEKIAISVKILV